MEGAPAAAGFPGEGGWQVDRGSPRVVRGPGRFRVRWPGAFAFFTAMLLALAPAPAAAHHAGGEAYGQAVDEGGRILFTTARMLTVGDQYLAADNSLYEVASIDGVRIIMSFVRREELPAERILPKGLLAEADAEAAEGEFKGTMAIYHTHNAESYVPTDGTHSILGAGGIHKVGGALAEALREHGVEVIHDETLHLPHDDGAYARSRPTAVDLLREGPDAIFDVHRDATPPSEYEDRIAGMPVTNVRIVVGTQNPNYAVNREYALSLKRVVDVAHPGLISGVLFKGSNYNQDLSPFSLLLEIGAHTNSREDAERAARLLAEGLAFYFYGPKEEGAGGAGAGRRSMPGIGAASGGGTSWQTAAALSALTLIAVMLFYVIGKRLKFPPGPP